MAILSSSAPPLCWRKRTSLCRRWARWPEREVSSHAMGSATRIAHASADVVLIGNDLRKFAATVKTARWCRAVILQNFYGTLIVDALGIALAAVGMINPLLAAFIHVSSELTFILNSTRLLPRFSR